MELLKKDSYCGLWGHAFVSAILCDFNIVPVTITAQLIQSGIDKLFLWLEFECGLGKLDFIGFSVIFNHASLLRGLLFLLKCLNVLLGPQIRHWIETKFYDINSFVLVYFGWLVLERKSLPNVPPERPLKLWFLCFGLLLKN